MHVRLSILFVIAVISAGGCATWKNEARPNLALRRELLAMCEVDQSVRQDFSPRMSAEKISKIQETDTRHLSRMKTIIARHGWPGRSLVGEDGSHAAWLLVQHADSTFMAECLPLMERAVTAGEASPRDYAYLFDRVRMQQGKPQLYGTQFTITTGGEFVLHPIEDEGRVDERRRAVGLPPMAEQEKTMREFSR